MDRRIVLKSAAAVAASLPFGRLIAAAAGSRVDLAAAARDAWLFGLPLIEMATARERFMAAGNAPCQLVHSRALVTPSTQTVTTPNNDTLYSAAWLDLGAGPVRLTVPASGARYLSAELMDMFGNVFSVVGTRTTGIGGGTFTIVGPDQRGNRAAIHSPTRWVWLLVRVLVTGEGDLAAAHALQDGFRIKARPSPPPRAQAPRTATWDAYFGSVQALLVENAVERGALATIDGAGVLGLGSPGGFDPRRFSTDQVAEIERGVAAGRRLLASAPKPGTVAGGWVYPKANLGNFGQDYLYRAQVAVGGLGALIPEEAMYMRPIAEDGRMVFDGGRAWVLRFPPDRLPPVEAFWSISMYRATADGQFFFIDNPIGRFAIGDRTPGLARGPGGGIDIWMQPDDPGDARRANWLPTPPTGPFGLVFRGYVPGRAMLNGTYRLPPLRSQDSTGSSTS